MQVIDLTHTITNDMPVFPGAEAIHLNKISDIDAGGYQEIRLALSSHTGTHLDCGRHLLKNSFETDTHAIESFYGKGVVIDCRSLRPGEKIGESFLRKSEMQIGESEFVVLHTGWSRYWRTDQYYGNFPVPDTDAAAYLATFPLKGIGIDAPGFDPVISTEWPVHIKLLSKGIVLVENLTNIGRLPSHSFMFCCFPLKIEHGDGSPVRAVGIV